MGVSNSPGDRKVPNSIQSGDQSVQNGSLSAFLNTNRTEKQRETPKRTTKRSPRSAPKIKEKLSAHLGPLLPAAAPKTDPKTPQSTTKSTKRHPKAPRGPQREPKRHPGTPEDPLKKLGSLNSWQDQGRKFKEPAHLSHQDDQSDVYRRSNDTKRRPNGPKWTPKCASCAPGASKKVTKSKALKPTVQGLAISQHSRPQDAQSDAYRRSNDTKRRPKWTKLIKSNP